MVMPVGSQHHQPFGYLHAGVSVVHDRAEKPGCVSRCTVAIVGEER